MKIADIVISGISYPAMGITGMKAFHHFKSHVLPISKQNEGVIPTFKPREFVKMTLLLATSIGISANHGYYHYPQSPLSTSFMHDFVMTFSSCLAVYQLAKFSGHYFSPQSFIQSPNWDFKTPEGKAYITQALWFEGIIMCVYGIFVGALPFSQ